MKNKEKQKEFIGPITTTSAILWILKSIGSAILSWITWCVLDRFRGRKTKTGIDKEVGKELS